MWLQWGRNVSIPEMSDCLFSVPSRMLASMGPECFHPGNSARCLDDARGDAASMGPECFHPGNVAFALNLALHCFASMGPECFHPGNHRFANQAVGHVGASMGPECFHPGNDPSAADDPQAGPLQTSE